VNASRHKQYGRHRQRLMKVDITDPMSVKRARSLIRASYAAQAKDRGLTINTEQLRKNKRFCEVEIVFTYYWHGTELPDDDAGRDCLYIAACHIWHIGRQCGPVAAIKAWASFWAPWCDPQELAALIKCVQACPKKWKADEMAQELGITFAVRQKLKLVTIGAIDVDKAGREKRRADESTKRSTKRRRKNGSVPREEYEASSKSKTEPWKPLGISRPTYFRWLKAGKFPNETSPNALKEGDSTTVFAPVSWVIKLPPAKLRKMIRLVSITAAVNEIGIIELPQAA
jgi:hypothetical protein